MNCSWVMRNGYTWFRGVPGAGWCVNNKWWVVKIGLWICVRRQIWDFQPQQVSGSEVCLNIIPERGNTQQYASGKPGICKLCLRIRYINSISHRQFFNHRMIRDELCWMYSVSNGSGLPGCRPGLEPDRTVQSGLLPQIQGYPPGSGTGSNRTAVPFYGSYNFGSN